MNEDRTVGAVIGKLRKEKGITQDELSKQLNVSAQAVSKWECGGTPDIEILPRIADFFGVSLDVLFSRPSDYEDCLDIVCREIAREPDERERFRKAMILCYGMQHALFGSTLDNPQRDYEAASKQKFAHSHLLCDSGFSMMGISKEMPYFLILPQTESRSTLIENTDFVKLFSALGNANFYHALIAIYNRKNANRFTRQFLVNTFSISDGEADEILSALSKYDFVSEETIDIDDGCMKTYAPIMRPELLGLLQFAYIVINKPLCHFLSSEHRQLSLLE